MGLHWAKSSSSLLILVASVVVHIVSCASSALFDRLLQTLPLHSSSPSLQHFEFTAALSILVFHLGGQRFELPGPDPASAARLCRRIPKFSHVSSNYDGCTPLVVCNRGFRLMIALVSGVPSKSAARAMISNCLSTSAKISYYSF